MIEKHSIQNLGLDTKKNIFVCQSYISNKQFVSISQESVPVDGGASSVFHTGHCTMQIETTWKLMWLIFKNDNEVKSYKRTLLGYLKIINEVQLPKSILNLGLLSMSVYS